MSERIWIVYKISCRDTGKSYIGITFYALSKRWAHHKNYAKSGKPGAFAAAIRKYGTDAFSRVILYEAVDQREASMVEKALIAAHRTLTPHGYNISTGGFHPGEMRPETKEKLLKALKSRPPISEETRAALRAGQSRRGPRGSPSAETRAKISASNKGRVISAESIAKGNATRKSKPTPQACLDALARGRATRYAYLADLTPEERLARHRVIKNNHERARLARIAISAGRTPGRVGRPPWKHRT